MDLRSLGPRRHQASISPAKGERRVTRTELGLEALCLLKDRLQEFWHFLFLSILPVQIVQVPKDLPFLLVPVSPLLRKVRPSSRKGRKLPVSMQLQVIRKASFGALVTYSGLCPGN